MYRKKAQLLLDNLLSSQTSPNPISPFDLEASQIIEAITNECKSTVIDSQSSPIRYGSSFTQEAVKSIAEDLVYGRSTVKAETMRKAILKQGAFIGIDGDVKIVKGVDAETGQRCAYLETAYIDDRDIRIPQEDMKNLLRSFARHIIINNNNSADQYFPPINRLKLWFEKITHKPFDYQGFENDFFGLLLKYSSLSNIPLLRQSAQYKTKQILSPKFVARVLENIKNGTAISLLDQKQDTFTNLLNQITSEMYDYMQVKIPNLNHFFNDINQLFKDIRAQLTAYTISLSGKTPLEIEHVIKRINDLSLTDTRRQYIGRKWI